MARFCRHWRLTPDEYKALRWDEFQAMTTVMAEEIEAANKSR